MSGRGVLLERAEGALWGLAVGDALGMPTQSLSRREILSQYGEIRGFEAPAPDHPLAGGLAPGTVTDDTEQAVLLGERLLPGGHLDVEGWAAALTAWEQRMRAKGSADLLGPSTKAALAAYRAGVPVTETGAAGTTNGAAMRITPVGVAVGSTDLDRLVDRVVEASMLTHSTSIALAAAAAVATAVSASLDGGDFAEAVDRAVSAAELAVQRGRWVAGASVAARIRWAVDAVVSGSCRDLIGFVGDLVGTSLASQESVPAAFAIAAAHQGDPFRAACTAASVGGDCDTIAAVAGALCGAAAGRNALPEQAVATVRRANGVDLDGLARRLVEIRCGSS